MKKILFLIGILLLVYTQVFSFMLMTNNSKVESGIVAYGIEETFDGSSSCISGGDSNCDNVNLFSANDRCDLSSINGAPEGTYCMECTPDGADIVWDISSVSEGANGKYVTMLFRLEEAATADGTIMALRDSSNNTLASIEIDGNGTDALRADFESTFPGNTSGSIAADTNVYIKIRYKADTGAANAELEYWLSSDGTTWTDNVSGNVDSSFTALDNIRFFVGAISATPVFYYDILRVDDEDIIDATN